MRVLIIDLQDTVQPEIGQRLRTDPAFVTETVRELNSDPYFSHSCEFDAFLVVLPTAPAMAELSLTQIRHAGWDGPILAVGERRDAGGVTNLFRAGADDYMPEPPDPEVLPSRLRALIRRNGGHATSYLEAGDLALDMNTRRVTWKGKLLDLTIWEYRVLEHLFLRRDHLASGEEIAANVFETRPIKSKDRIDELISSLRKKIDEISPGFMIEIPSRGWYRFCPGMICP